MSNLLVYMYSSLLHVAVWLYWDLANLRPTQTRIDVPMDAIWHHVDAMECLRSTSASQVTPGIL